MFLCQNLKLRGWLQGVSLSYICPVFGIATYTSSVSADVVDSFAFSIFTYIFICCYFFD